MQIVCPSCATSYDIDVASLMPNGRQVRCVRCRAVWRAELSQAEKLTAAAEAIAPAHAMADAAAGSFAAEPEPPFAEETPFESDVIVVPADFAEGEPPAAETNVAKTGEPGTAVEVDAPPLAPIDLGGEAAVEAAAEDHAADAEPSFEDIETYAARRDKRGRRFSLRWPLSNLQSAILALLVIDAIVVGWRNDFVRVFPQTASFYATLGLPVNLRGVVLNDIATTTEQRDGVPILVVEGNVVNDTRRIVDVPRLKFVVRNAVNEEIYSWTAVPPRTTLPPGETVAFRSRLASPPPDGRDVLVRFVTRRDIISGTR
jgi:predicted Zn finger-like uncharacterized protein